MEQINLYFNQQTYGSLPQEFVGITRVSPLNQSFYTSLSISLFLQLCRLKNTTEYQGLSQTLSNLIKQGLSTFSAPIIVSSAQYFEGFLHYISQHTFPDYEKLIYQYVSYLPNISRILVAQILTSKGLTSEASDVINMKNLPSDDQTFMNIISEILNIAIEVHYGNVKKLFCQSKLPGTKILLIFSMSSTGSSNEYSMPIHNLYNEFLSSNDQRLLTGYPFCYNPSPLQSPPSFVSHPPGIPKDALAQPMNQLTSNSKSSSSELLQKLLKIITERGWRFSEAQVIELKPLMKNLGKIEKYSEIALSLTPHLKNKLCDHSFIHYSTLSCDKKHCIKCLNDEIELKSLNRNQVFCECKLRLSDPEMKYYFPQVFKNSMRVAENVSSSSSLDQPMRPAPEIDQPMQPTPAVMDHQAYPPLIQAPNLAPAQTYQHPPVYSQPDAMKHSAAYSNPPVFSNVPAPQVPNPGYGFPGTRPPGPPYPSNPEVSNTSLTRPKFCYKCTNPIPVNSQVQVEGRFYHKTCVKT